MDGSFHIRVGAKAVVVSEGRLLAVACDDGIGPHYNLPGGGVEADERIPDAPRREVSEEPNPNQLGVEWLAPDWIGDESSRGRYRPDRPAPGAVPDVGGSKGAGLCRRHRALGT